MSEEVTKDQIVNKKLHYLFFAIAVIGMFLGGFALATVQGAYDNPQIRANQDNINFLLNHTLKAVEVDILIGEQTLILKTELQLFQNQTDDTFTVFQNEIVKIKNDIRNKFPQGSPVEKEEQETIATTPFLTLKMDQTEFLLGEIITFTGIASPNYPIMITIKLADRTLESVPVSKTDIINGEYSVEFQTSFDDPIGTWQVYARQLGDQTKTITFKVQ